MWFKECFKQCQFVEGYGTTEAGSLATDSGEMHIGVDFKLVDVPELGYLETYVRVTCAYLVANFSFSDKPYPRGELYVKTKTMIKGYYKNEEENKKQFDEEGWFKTGDIVELIDITKIRIIDRKKNIFKLAQVRSFFPYKNFTWNLAKTELIHDIRVNSYRRSL